MSDSNAGSTIEVLFEDEHLLAIHKPEQVQFHSDNEHVGIVRQLRDLLGTDALFPVHRLDKMTSGLMVFAKNARVNSELSRLLVERKVEKYYLALSHKKPQKKQGSIVGDMCKARGGSYRLSREKNQPAVTRFVAKSLASQQLVADDSSQSSSVLWLFALKPETGKTHQLRVALKSLASPILGDQRYGGHAANRGYLHAYRMRFDMFGKAYDLSDSFFIGEHIDLSQLKADSIVADILSLPWPKASFKLD